MICFREVGFCVALFTASLKPGKQVTVVVNMSLFENVCYECSFYNVFFNVFFIEINLT